MAGVERLFLRRVVRRIHNYLDFQGDPFQHDFLPLRLSAIVYTNAIISALMQAD
jgi:hypothetical protein